MLPEQPILGLLELLSGILQTRILLRGNAPCDVTDRGVECSWIVSDARAACKSTDRTTGSRAPNARILSNDTTQQLLFGRLSIVRTSPRIKSERVQPRTIDVAQPAVHHAALRGIEYAVMQIDERMRQRDRHLAVGMLAECFGGAQELVEVQGACLVRGIETVCERKAFPGDSDLASPSKLSIAAGAIAKR